MRINFIIALMILSCGLAYADSSILINPANGHHYQQVDANLTWNDAKTLCENTEGYLATLTSAEENTFVYENFGPGPWLGGTDEGDEGNWRWVTGEPWVYENWAENEPNNCCPAESCGPDECTPEHYLSHYGDPNGDEWNDNPNGERSFICEWDSVPLGSGTISGTVYEAGGTTAIGNLHIYATDSTTGDWINGVNTEADGSYSLILPAGSYRIGAAPEDTGYSYAREYFDGVYNDNSATIVSVTAGQDTPNIDFSLDPAGTVSGHVYEAGGTTAIGGLHLYAIDSTTEDWINGVNTEADGSYSLLLPTGAFYIQVCPDCSDPGYDYVREYFDGVNGTDLATVVSVTAGEDTPNIDFSLEPAGTVSGHVYEAGGTTAIGDLHLYAIDSTTEDWINGVNTETDGSYSLSLPEGDYKIKACPDCDGYSFTFAPEYFDDTPYQSLASVVSVTAGLDTPDIDFLLEQGGNISGTVTTDPAGANLDNIQVIVKNEDGEWITSGSVNPDGSYSTNYIAAGNYIIEFRDNSDQFQDEYYDQVPTWSRSSATQVSVISGATTPDIDVTLKEVTFNRYYPTWSSISTYHTYNNSTMTTSTWSWGEIQVGFFSDGNNAKRATIYSDLEIIKPSGTCSDDSFSADSIWRFRVYDDDPNDGTIGDNEIDDPHTSTYYSKMCGFGNVPHEAGNYTFNITLPDNDEISKTMTGVTKGFALSEFPPVTNLSASWNTNDDTMTVSWTPLSGFSYPAGTHMGVRLYLFKNGQYINNQIRVSKLPTNITSFTFRPDMTIYFDTGNVDQILVDVRVIEENWATVTRSRQAYTFDWLTKNLTPAPIKMTLLDVDGDKQTGLAEAIYSLQAVSGN